MVVFEHSGKRAEVRDELVNLGVPLILSIFRICDIAREGQGEQHERHLNQRKATNGPSGGDAGEGKAWLVGRLHAVENGNCHAARFGRAKE